MERKREGKKRSLSSGEALVMKAIWDSCGEVGGDTTVPKLTEVLLRDYGKEYGRTAIGSFLDKLIEKGFIKRHRAGRLQSRRGCIRCSWKTEIKIQSM